MDCDLLIENGRYELEGNVLHSPPWIAGSDYGHFFVDVFHHLESWIVQIAHTVNGSGSYIRRRLAYEWTPWTRFTTAEPPQVFDLALGEHVIIQTGYPSKYWKNFFDEVGVLICLAIPENVSLQGAERIAMLPEGFHPQDRVIISAGFISKEVRQGGASIDILQDGSLHYFGPELTSGDTLWGTTTFVAQDV